MLRILGPKTRLLLLDDDPSMQRLMSTLLKRAGYKVDVVSSGSQAIELMDKNDYDGLLLDIMTPTDGGMTVIRHLKEKKPQVLDRILLVTGSPEAVLKTIINDVFGVVYKPFEADQLLDAVGKLLNQSAPQ